MSSVLAHIRLSKGLSDQPQYFWIKEKVEVMAFLYEGEPYVYASICPHMGAQLFYDSKERAIRCPWHPLKANAKTGCADHHKYARVKRFDAKLEKDELTIFESRQKENA